MTTINIEVPDTLADRDQLIGAIVSAALRARAKIFIRPKEDSSAEAHPTADPDRAPT